MWTTIRRRNRTACGFIDYLHGMTDLLINHWSELALALITMLSTYTALTESEKDDKVVDVLKRVIQAIVLGKSRRN